MKPYESDGIEFESWDVDRDVQEISRHSFRIPISELDNVAVRIDSRLFEIVNITSEGISFLLESADDFFIGDIIDTIELEIEGDLFIFKGRVRHISPRDTDGFLCGIELIDSAKSGKRQFLEFIQRKHNHVLTSSIIASQR